jgi:diadenosine tetraphosphate (Ap4A) HIT family hydrolase
MFFESGIMQSCPFCTTPELTERSITQNTLARAFLTNIPIVPGHTLIVPLRHVLRFNELTGEERDAIFNIRETLRKTFTILFGAEGFHTAWNEGAVAGQSIPHFHLHMIPRKKSDAGITEYDPRKFLYRPGSREATPEAELATTAELIRKNIEK